MRFKIDWASLIVEGEFTVSALFYFVFESQFSKYKPAGGLYLEGRFNGRFLRYPFGEVIFGGAYFRNFTVCWVSKQVGLCTLRELGLKPVQFIL